MLKHFIRRLFIALPVLLGVTIITYTIISLAPGDAVDILIDPTRSQEELQQLRTQLGLNDPIPVRYAKWVGELMKGNLGYSYTTRRPVSEAISERFGPTIILTVSSLVLAYLIAIPIGIASAVKQYSITDYVSTIIGLLGYSMPNFFLGLGMIYLLSLKLDLFPVGGMYTLGKDRSLIDLAHHLFLPAMVLGMNTMGSVMRYTRSSMLETIRQDYIRTARAKGLAERIVVYKHALRNGMIPIVTLLSLQVPALVGGAVITEQVFGWPGMGRLAISAIGSRDYPIIMALNLITALMVVVSGLLSDVVYSIIDPRIRYS